MKARRGRSVRCKKCKRPTLWILRPFQRAMLCDPDPVHLSIGSGGVDLAVCEDGDLKRGMLTTDPEPGDVFGYQPHFQTCPVGRRPKRRRADRMTAAAGGN